MPLLSAYRATSNQCFPSAPRTGDSQASDRLPARKHPARYWQETLQVGRDWGQTGQVEEHSADQGCLVRIRSRPQTFRLQARFDKSVDWRAGPLAVTQFGFRTFKRPKGPKFLSLLNADLILDHSLARPWVRRPTQFSKTLMASVGSFFLGGICKSSFFQSLRQAGFFSNPRARRPGEYLVWNPTKDLL